MRWSGEARPGLRRRVLVLLAGLGLGAASDLARGDACSDCGPPTDDQIEAAEGFARDVRDGETDYVLTDGGECDVVVDGSPTYRKLASWLVLRGTGEVWNCPHSKSADTISVSAARQDSQGWSLTGEVQVGGTVLGVGMSTKIAESVSRSIQITTKTEIRKTIQANWCYRIPWFAYFEVARYFATVDVTLVRRFAWWTKNEETGSTVHRQGNIWIPCGTTQATLTAQAPIAGFFHLTQRGCGDVACLGLVEPRDLGFFPPPPIPAPTVTPGDGQDDAAEDGEDAPGEDVPAPEGDPTEAPAPEGEATQPEGDPVPSSDTLGDPPTGASP